jgi:hypothetical protein
MLNESRQPVLALICVAVIAFAVGYFVSRNSVEAKKRDSESVQGASATWRGKHSTAPKIGKRSASLSGTGGLNPPDITSEHPESRQFFEKIGVTREDLRRVEEMEKRRAQGEYILQNERPTTRKFLDHDFAQIVAQAAAEKAPEYDQLFAQMGVSPEVTEQLRTHVAKIHRASLEAEVAMQQILQARRDYDQRLRSTLSEENYQQYRHHEEAKPALREYQEFQRFVTEQKIALDPQHEPALVGLLQTTQAYTSRSWHGPFDGLPEPIFGAENVIPAEERKIAEITERAGRVLEFSAQAGVPDQYGTLLERYYAGKVQQRKALLEELKTQFAINTSWPSQGQ